MIRETRIAMTGLALVSALALAGCGGEEDTSGLAGYLKSKVPTSRAVAAGYMFLSCELDGDKPVCENCDVTIHTNDNGGLTGYATHWYHDMKQEDGQWKQSASGERANQKFESAEAGPAASNAMLDEGGKWCAARGEGEYVILKQES